MSQKSNAENHLPVAGIHRGQKPFNCVEKPADCRCFFRNFSGEQLLFRRFCTQFFLFSFWCIPFVYAIQVNSASVCTIACRNQTHANSSKSKNLIIIFLPHLKTDNPDYHNQSHSNRSHPPENNITSCNVVNRSGNHSTKSTA